MDYLKGFMYVTLLKGQKNNNNKTTFWVTVWCNQSLKEIELGWFLRLLNLC